jgi:hypothetical protein
VEVELEHRINMPGHINAYYPVGMAGTCSGISFEEIFQLKNV